MRMLPDSFHLARVAVLVAGFYLLLGVGFAPWFVWRGVGRLDPHAREATFGFRLIIMPGVIAFWPVLLGRLLAGATEPPMERNAHRRAAVRPSRETRP